SSFKSPYLFNGKELDRETNLTNFGARYLDMKTSLWLNTDPLAEKYPGVSPYTYCLNNPILYIDPDGREVIVPNKTDRASVLKMINSKAVGTFAFNKSGKLYLAKSSGDTNNLSTYYRDKLVEAINDKDKISISIGQTYMDKGTSKDVDIDAGGGVTVSGTTTKTTTTTDAKGKKTVKTETSKYADITISGNPYNNLQDNNGNKLADEPADILAHELVGHAIPKLVKPDTGNAVDNENKVRAEVKVPGQVGPSPLRKTEPTHKE
ncbi:RHS repeat-associated core domain-containing protein, partial [Flavobacterium psychrophilum]